jgi:carboxylesterase type B
MVEKATSIGQPFICVTVNYRLGYFGFLSCEELRNEARAPDGLYRPNPGLYDQRLALEWVIIFHIQCIVC